MRLPVSLVFCALVCITAPAARAHDHHAPHGGALVELGDEYAHLEVVVDASGRLRLWVLDGEAELGVPVAHPELELWVRPATGRTFELHVPAVANPLSGETVGATSEFSLTDSRLRGGAAASVVLRRIDVLGRSFEGVGFALRAGATGAGR
jgi:hypothetical protein